MKNENKFNAEIEEISTQIKHVKPKHILKLFNTIRENPKVFECS